MSSTAGISGGQGLVQFLKGVTRVGGVRVKGAETEGSIGGAEATKGQGGPTAQEMAFFSDLESAVTGALGGVADGGDARAALREAIARVVAGDEAEVPTEGETPVGDATPVAETEPDGTTVPVESGEPAEIPVEETPAAPEPMSRKEFFGMLKEHGIAPGQFRKDVVAALRQSRETGEVDRAKAFASVPAGVAVDVAG